MSMSISNKGDYVTLARLARKKREQSEYVDELRTVLQHCHAAQRILGTANASGYTKRDILWQWITNVIDLAEQELKKRGVEV